MNIMQHKNTYNSTICCKDYLKDNSKEAIFKKIFPPTTVQLILLTKNIKLMHYIIKKKKKKYQE